MLYIVSLPIGNCKDITTRAVEILQQVDLILCEDSRQFGKYQRRYNLTNKISTYEDFREREVTPRFIELLKKGYTIALVSDGGTPMIADPGYHLLAQCYENNIKVCPVPGACAVITGVSMCPFNNGEFYFSGFYQRNKHLQLIINSQMDMVFFESPKRIIKSLQEILLVLEKDRIIFVAKEMTKDFETFYLIKEIPDLEKIIPMGEFLFIVSKKNSSNETINYEEIHTMFGNLYTKDLAKVISYFKKVPSKEVYSRLITMKCDKIDDK